MNLAAALRASAARQGDRTALVELSLDGEPRRGTFSELDAAVQRAAAGFAARGIGAGDRVLVVIRPGIDLYVTVFGALCVGATAAFLDAQAPRATQLRALEVATPAAVVAPAPLLRAGLVVPALRRARLRVATGGAAPGAVRLERLLATPPPDRPICVERADDDLAFVTYTSGSTGRPKGVPRTHGLLRRQHEALQANFPMSADEVALVGFPMLGVHTLLVGCTAVLVPVDERFGPERLAVALDEHAITSVGLGPAAWRELLPVLDARPTPPPALHYVGTGGAPLSLEVARRLHDRFPDATCYCAYGSSEAEPVARIELGRFLVEAARARSSRDSPGGYPVGTPVPEVRVRVLDPAPLERAVGATAAGAADHPRAQVEVDVEGGALAPGEVGEIVLAGANVVEHYVADEAATRRTKVRDMNGTTWHRTGDLGWFDATGGLWLVGRLADRVQGPDGRVVDPYPVELAVDEVDGVLRSALIAHAARPSGELVVQARPGAHVDAAAVARVLGAHGLDVPVVPAPVPLDARIRSKIDRVALRRRRQAVLDGGARRIGPRRAKGRGRPSVLQSGGS